MNYFRPLSTLLFGMAAFFFFGLAYPHHLHYQEQYQLFLFDSNYVWEIVRMPGGVADLLGRFCTQFFLFAWVGALIIAVLLSAIQLLTLQILKKSEVRGQRSEVRSKKSEVRGASILSFVPAFLLWLFLLDENALLGGVWAVLLTLLAAWIYPQTTKRPTPQTTKRPTPQTTKRLIFLIAAIPILYWIAGPVCIVFFLLQIPSNKQSAWYYGVIVLLAVMIIILANYLPVPASRLWTGIHYHRYPTVIPILLWAAALSVFIFSLIIRTFHRTSPSFGGGKGEVSFLLVAIVMGCLIWKSSNFKAEKVMQYDFMARFQQWNRILETINADKPNNQIGVTVQNLALAKCGLLADHLFDYHQNGISGLLPDVQRDATSPLPTAEVFYQLGMTYTAQRTVFEAQEAILDFQKSGRCYKRLAETNLINGSYEVARKYLMALQKTLFYRKWASETLPLIGNEEAIAKHPEYGQLRQMAYDKDFFFGDQVTSEMLENLYSSNTDNRLACQYLMAYYLLTGDRDSYAKLLLHLQRVKSEE